jgi:hypothetical protein
LSIGASDSVFCVNFCFVFLPKEKKNYFVICICVYTCMILKCNTYLVM